MCHYFRKTQISERSREKMFAFSKMSTISREKAFAFCCFEIYKGMNFREKHENMRKMRKFLPAKVSALKAIDIKNFLI